MAAILTEAEIRAAALEPRKAKNEHGEIENRTMDELLLTEQFQTVEQAASPRSAWAGLRAARVILPGAQ